MDVLRELDELLVNPGSPLIVNRVLLQAARDELMAVKRTAGAGAVTRTMVRLNGSEYPVPANVAGAINQMRLALRHARDIVGAPSGGYSGLHSADYVELNGVRASIGQVKMIEETLSRYDDKTVDAG